MAGAGTSTTALWEAVGVEAVWWRDWQATQWHWKHWDQPHCEYQTFHPSTFTLPPSLVDISPLTNSQLFDDVIDKLHNDIESTEISLTVSIRHSPSLHSSWTVPPSLSLVWWSDWH